jgi:UvrD/REP helicase N-terminal domain
VVGKIIYLRQSYHFGPHKIAMYLKRYHDIQISPSGISHDPIRKPPGPSAPNARVGSVADLETVLAGLNDAQCEDALALRGPVAILAGAGTGETTTITRRIACQVRSGAFEPSQILAVTFTDKVAGQLLARLAARGAETWNVMPDVVLTVWTSTSPEKYQSKTPRPRRSRRRRTGRGTPT